MKKKENLSPVPPHIGRLDMQGSGNKPNMEKNRDRVIQIRVSTVSYSSACTVFSSADPDRRSTMMLGKTTFPEK